MKPKNKHLSTTILLNGKAVEIDNELVPVIKELNKVGLKTTQCCQSAEVDKKALAYITFSLKGIEDVAIRQKGKKLVIWWERKE